MGAGMAQAAAADGQQASVRDAAPDGPLLDLPHLSRQTLSDPGLEREVLALFAGQLRVIASRLDEAGDRHVLLHTLKGSARAVGAFPLAEEAEYLQAAPRDASALEAFRTAVERTLFAIGQRLG